MTCHKTYETCPHMCPAKCHFGPCPPCARRDVPARCKCGKIRKHFACAEVWGTGKQLVLQCDEDCKLNETEAAEVEVTAETQSAPPLQEEDATLAAPPVDLRERRKLKKEKQEKELEERRLREEATQRRLAFRKRLRSFGIVLGVFFSIVMLCYFVYMARERHIDSLEQKHKRRPRKDSEW